MPPPGRQSLSAMLRSGDLVASGEPLALPRALHLLERLLEVVRGTAPGGTAPEVERDVRQIEGRYHRLAKAGGASATVYGEAAGAGPAVVFLHTAGADSRQYQAQLADVELARRFRLHAFDLPLHGRSLPPDGWDGGRWTLRQADYAAWCVAYLEQVVRDRAVVVGCSMGAAMSLVLAALRPDLVRGVVALEAPFRAPGRLSPALAHAGVNSATHNPSYVRGLMGPRTTVAARRAATWIYGQGGFGVYAGDLAFYSEEFDGGATAPLIDAARCPVAFLSGAYDYSASPADAQRLAALIPGATVQVMPELGHFPMIEAPDAFRVHFLPALQRVSGQGGR
ncbi:MAG: alpha/beta hydrolase [Myxococcales bacterium]